MNPPPRPSDACFWETPGPRWLLPGDVPPDRQAAAALAATGLCDPLVFASSGSTGAPKLVVLTRRAVLDAARLACDWLGIDQSDRLLCVLPLDHVGGCGLAARARVTGAALLVDHGKWHAERFVRLCREAQATQVSLVPTQVFDLVTSGLEAPPGLRMVVVGGGALDPATAAAAKRLGWPLRASFGMTETAAQIATERPDLVPPGPGWLPLITGWQAGTGPDDHLRVRGPGLFAGYLEPAATGGWHFRPRADMDGWHVTSDLADCLADGSGRLWLHPRGRADDRIKIRGELVSLAGAQTLAEAVATERGIDPRALAIADLADERAGRRLLLAGESIPDQEMEKLTCLYNRRCPPFARLTGWFRVPGLPRSALGKIRRGNLRELAARATIRPAGHAAG
jgi:o-succinylbenzoate---CoA ligase